MAANAMIRLTEQDYNRVKRLLAELTHQSSGMQASLKILEEVLDVARVVRPERVSNSVVTMNSLVHFQDVRTQERGTVTIVYPADADSSNGQISVPGARGRGFDRRIGRQGSRASHSRRASPP